MKSLSLVLILFTLMLHSLTFAQTVERDSDFTISPSIILEGDVQVAYEWLHPTEFKKKNISLIDVPGVSELKPNNNQMVVSKIAFISKKSFDNLTFDKMNNAQFISELLNSIGIRQKATELWYVTNRVKAYSIPFKVSFDLKLKAIFEGSIDSQITNYFKDQASGLKGTGRERFLSLDMTNFTQLMHRNYSIVYMKEISPDQTMIVAGIISGFDLHAANRLFNYPPFSSTRSTMMGNLRSQILNMAYAIQ